MHKFRLSLATALFLLPAVRGSKNERGTRDGGCP